MPSLILRPGSPGAMTHRWRDVPCTLGRSPANDIQLDEDAVSGAHALIERRGTDFWLIDLGSTNGTYLNGKKIKEAVLRNGDEIYLGEVVPLRFELKPDELQPPAPAYTQPEVTVMPPSPLPGQPTPMQAAGMPQDMALAPISAAAGGMGGGQLAPRGVQCPSCQAFIPFSVNFCPRCGFSLSQTTLPAFPMQNNMPMPGQYVRPMEAPGGSIGMLPLLAFLCGLSIIGFPFAIILGLLALGQIRRHGGLSQDRKQAMTGVSLGIIWLLVFAAGGTWWGWHKYQVGRADFYAKAVAENEEKVVGDLKGIARAEKLAKVVHFKDPSGSGVGQFLTIEELGKVGTSSFNRELIAGHTHGYRFNVRQPTETDYTAVAEPDDYGATGKRTFTIDYTGKIRGEDLNGKSYAQRGTPLPELTEIRSAFDDKEDDAIAKEAIAWAKRLANEGKYEDSRKILDLIPEQFAMTSAAAELQATKKSVDPFIVEAQAQARYQKAKAAADAGDLKLAIGMLKEITDLYPSYTRIATVTDELNKYTTTLAQKLDKEAKALFEKAQQLERDNKPDEALDLYVQIEKNYPETEWAKRIADVRPGLQLSVREKGAEQLFAQARNLSLTENYRDIVSIVEQLMRNYTDTDYVKQNAGPIVALHQKALAQQYRAQAIEQMDGGRDADALARLEEAVVNNPDLKPAFKDLFLKLYLRVGRRRMNEGDSRWALQLFRKYLALEPEKSELSPAEMCQLTFAVAKSDFAQGHYPEAAQNLLAARAGFDKDAEYNDLFGNVLVVMGKYEDSLAYFDRALAAKPTVGNFYARRGYAQLVRALYIEQDAMTAFAGLLDQDSTAALPTAAPAAMPAAAPTDTNAPPAPDRLAAPAPTDASLSSLTNQFTPTFATELPKTVLGVRPEVQVKYDAAASQALLDEVLDLIDQIHDAGSGSDIDHSSKRVAHVNKWTKARQAKTPSSNTDTNAASSNAVARAAQPGNTKLRLNRIRTGVELGNAVSAVHQKVLDNNGRKTKALEALRRMNTLFTNGDRDLAHAIQLGADRAPALTEILKATQQHELKINEAANKIATYLAVEIELLQHAYDIAESSYRNLRVQQMGAATDPTVVLDIYFAKLFDRRDFDRGVQSLREAGAVKVPFDGYELVPPPATESAPSAANALLQRLTAPANSAAVAPAPAAATSAAPAPAPAAAPKRAAPAAPGS